MQTCLTPSAVTDLDAIEAYISEENPDAAVKTVLQVLKAIEGLADFPNIGRPGRVPGTRELVVTNSPFIAAYRIRANTLWIVRIIHSARRWPR